MKIDKSSFRALACLLLDVAAKEELIPAVFGSNFTPCLPPQSTSASAATSTPQGSIVKLVSAIKAIADLAA
jgi:hypothetical protein